MIIAPETPLREAYALAGIYLCREKKGPAARPPEPDVKTPELGGETPPKAA